MNSHLGNLLMRKGLISNVNYKCYAKSFDTVIANKANSKIRKVTSPVRSQVKFINTGRLPLQNCNPNSSLNSIVLKSRTLSNNLHFDHITRYRKLNTFSFGLVEHPTIPSKYKNSFLLNVIFINL